MTTATVWLLVALATFKAQTTVVERFPTMQECERVRAILDRHQNTETRHQCIQATIVVRP